MYISENLKYIYVSEILTFINYNLVILVLYQHLLRHLHDLANSRFEINFIYPSMIYKFILFLNNLFIFDCAGSPLLLGFLVVSSSYSLAKVQTISLWWLLLLWGRGSQAHTGLRNAAHGLSSCGSQSLEHTGSVVVAHSCSCGIIGSSWIKGIELKSSALTGEFFITEPAGKPPDI